jgi:hypothetical protein
MLLTLQFGRLILKIMFNKTLIANNHADYLLPSGLVSVANPSYLPSAHNNDAI